MSEAAFHALAEPHRRGILRLLRGQPRSVTEIAEQFDITQQAVSQHLKVLKVAGLVTDRAEGTRRVYRLNPAGIAALRDQLETFWNRALDGYQNVVERPTEEGS